MFRLVLAVTIFAGSVLSAAACGGGLITALMFRAFPETKVVFEATIDAEQAGLITGERWPGYKVVSLHEWRRAKVAATVERLRNRFAKAAVPIPENGPVYVLLIKEFRWIEIGRVDGRTHIALLRSSPQGDVTRVFTTRRTLDNLLTRTITWRQALDAKLVAGIGPAAIRDRWFDVFETIMTRKIAQIAK